jgi:Restriction Enzyme Adenine Methylase Associated/Type I restriction enzyme R protein N terminus (HSDR_N)
MDASSRRVLADTVGKVRARIQQIRERGETIGEQDTKATLIEPILAALGWRLEELDDVRREYKYKSPDNPVDYALFVLRQPRLFVEAKPFGSALGRKCASQVLGYASVMGVGWCVVSNGDEYRLYNSHAAVDVDEKLFRTVCLSDPAEEAYALETLGLIAKDTMGDNALESLWTSQFVDRRVKAAFEEVFRDEDGGLARLLRKRAPELSLAEIRDSLKRADLRVSFPVVVTPPFLNAPAGRSVVGAPVPAPSGPQSSRGPRITPRSLLQAGLIKAPLTIEATYKGAQLMATIDANGSVVYAGTSHGSLSAAGGAAKASVNLTPSGEPFPATNGWTFWQYRDPGSSQLVPMDRLYQRFVELQTEGTAGTT